MLIICFYLIFPLSLFPDVKTHPSSFQICLMGSKGMLLVDYHLSGNTICLRLSMIKFEAPNLPEIKVAQAFDWPRPYFLNWPLIMLLEGLGVKFEVFKKYQDMAVVETRKAVDSMKQAATMLENFGIQPYMSVSDPGTPLMWTYLDVCASWESKPYVRSLLVACFHIMVEKCSTVAELGQIYRDAMSSQSIQNGLQQHSPSIC